MQHGCSYPYTRTVDVVEEVADLRVPDPYRWLEEESADVRAWQEAQGRLAASYVRDWPGFGAVRALVERFAVEGVLETVPRFAGGLWFRADTTPDQAPRVIVADEPFGAGRVVVDLADFQAAEGTPYLSWSSPSPDGAVLAIGVCTDGSEQNRISLVDVATGAFRPDAPSHVLYDGWLGGVTWLPDSSGFFYLALTGDVRDFDRAVFRHRLGAPAPVEPEPIPLPAGSRQPTLIQVSHDGRWAVAAHGERAPRPVAVRDLGDPNAQWRAFVTTVDGKVAGHVVGDHYVAVTDVGADRGRVVAIALDGPADPDDAATWAELVPESDAVLRTVTPVGDALYVHEVVDTYSQVRIIDTSGQPIGSVPLPAPGTVNGSFASLLSLVPQGHPERFVFSFSTLVTSRAVYCHRPGNSGIETLAPAAVSIDDAVVEDHWVGSADGTAIPYHTVRLTSTDPSRPAPTLIYAYGGFNNPFPPSFPGPMAAFVAAGGVFVHAHLRGGAEFGRAWWEDGRRARKQNSYRDLYAVAEDLIARDVTRPDLLGVTGVSNGGLMTGVAVTQRPDLWKVAVPVVPMLDLLGGLRSPYTAEATRSDRGDPDSPDDVRRLASYSPYHQVKAGTRYPAVFISAGATDPRCPPWHARKWSARMQAAQAGDDPILVHVWDGSGHGLATPGAIAVEDHTERLAFIMRQLGLTPRTTTGAGPLGQGATQ